MIPAGLRILLHAEWDLAALLIVIALVAGCFWAIGRIT